MTIQWLTGDALEQVQSLPDISVDLIATSPPFLSLRNYNDLPGQWGSEPTPAAFLDNLLALATECRRVLAPHGSLAFELGDTFSGSGGAGGDYNGDGMRDGQPTFTGSARRDRQPIPRQNNGGPAWPLPKSLTGIPTLFAWSLAYGHNLLNPEHTFEPWRIRNVIVWARNNPPVGALGDKVRPATSYITVACPSRKRWFDLDAVRTSPKSGPPGEVTGHRIDRGGYRGISDGGEGGDVLSSHPAGAPPLDHWHDEYDGDLTWLVNTAGSSLAHYAMWPARLAERLILSMCPAQVCRDCGEPRRRITKRTRVRLHDGERDPDRVPPTRVDAGGATGIGIRHGMGVEIETVGWSDCGHGNYRPGVVLDCFAGSGTTCCVAELHGRDSTGIDLDPTSEGLLPKRMVEVKRALFGFKDEQVDGQIAMFGTSL